MKLQNKSSKLYDFVRYVLDRLSYESGVNLSGGNLWSAIERADIDDLLSEDQIRFLVAYFKNDSSYFSNDSLWVSSFCTNFYVRNYKSISSLTKRLGVGSSADDDCELIVASLLVNILDYSYGIDDFDLSQDFLYY